MSCDEQENTPNLPNVNFKGMDFFNHWVFEVIRRFQNMEIEMNEILNIEVFKQRSKSGVQINQVSCLRGSLCCRLNPFEIHS